MLGAVVVARPGAVVRSLEDRHRPRPSREDEFFLLDDGLQREGGGLRGREADGDRVPVLAALADRDLELHAGPLVRLSFARPRRALHAAFRGQLASERPRGRCLQELEPPIEVRLPDAVVADEHVQPTQGKSDVPQRPVAGEGAFDDVHAVRIPVASARAAGPTR